jgi:hypothetical protein
MPGQSAPIALQLLTKCGFSQNLGLSGSCSLAWRAADCVLLRPLLFTIFLARLIFLQCPAGCYRISTGTRRPT